jgi:MFS family permease
MTDGQATDNKALDQNNLSPKIDEQATQGFFAYRNHRELDFSPTGGLRWLLIFVIVWVYCVEQLERLKIGSVLPYLFEEFSVGLRDWGNLGMMGAIASALGAFVMSNAAERYGRRIVIVLCIFAMSILSVLIALAQSWLMVSFLYIAAGFVVSAAGPASHAALRDLTPRIGRAFAFSLLSMGMTGGALLATSTAALTIPIWPGWRPQFWLAAVVGIFTCALAIFFYRDLSARVRGKFVRGLQQDQRYQVPKETVVISADAHLHGLRIYRDWRTWVLSTSMLFWAITYVGVAMYVPLYLVQEHGMDVASSARMTSVFYVVFTIAILGSGWLSDRLGLRKIVTAFGGVACGAGFIVLGLLPQGINPLVLNMLFAYLGLTAGFIYPAFCALISENAEEISPFAVARAFGMMNVIVQLGIFVLNLIVPWVREEFGWNTWMVISGILCIGIAVSVAFGRGPWLKRTAAPSIFQ